LRFDKKLIAVTAVLAITFVVACSSEETPFATTTAVPPTSSVPTAADGARADTTGDPAIGEGVFTSNGCSACHSTGDNTIVGPGLAGIGVRGDAAYIEQSVREPGVVVVDGFANIMPITFANMSGSDMANLIAYLKTLN